MGEPKQRLKTRHRILIADQDLLFARRLADYLWDHGYEARAIQSVSEARGQIRDWRPQSVFVGLNLTDAGALSLMRFINSDIVRVKPVVTVMAKQNLKSSIAEVRREGVQHSLLKPFPLEDVLRIVSRTSPQAGPPTPFLTEGIAGRVNETDPVRELHLLNLILKQAMQDQEQGRLFNLLRMVNLKVKAIRSSLIHCVDDQRAVVVASNDDENIGGHQLRLDKYPEIMAVKKSLKPLIIPNVRTSDILSSVQDTLAQTPFETLVLFPVTRRGVFYGVLSLRMEQKDPVEMYYIEKFGQVCAHILALSIAHPTHEMFR